MGSTPAVTFRQAIKVAKFLGFMEKTRKGTSHTQHQHPKTGKKVTIPDYGSENYGPDLLSNICRQMGITKKEFFKILKRTHR